MTDLEIRQMALQIAADLHRTVRLDEGPTDIKAVLITAAAVEKYLRGQGD